jgi:phosphatidate phosphatase APP1
MPRRNPVIASIVWFRWRLRGAVRWWRNWWNRHLEIEIVPYLGYASRDRVYLIGRVLKDLRVGPGEHTDTRWRNFVNTYKRFMSHEIPGARVRARIGDIDTVLVTNDEGYFEATLDLPHELPAGWADVRLELQHPAPRGEHVREATGRVLVPGDRASFGVISDMDDTIMQTDATRWMKVLVKVLVGNAATRLPFAGVAAFYEALRRGGSGRELNPLFYVSSSPWNLYDLLHRFLELERIPEGPLLLRDWGGSDGLIPRQHGAYKNGQIHRILETYPDLPFILIGDSGQEDPEIYRDVVRDFPERILAVYIRNVSGESRAGAVHELALEVERVGSVLVLADDTLAAARHAATRGWVTQASLAAVEESKEKDERQLAF